MRQEAESPHMTDAVIDAGLWVGGTGGAGRCSRRLMTFPRDVRQQSLVPASTILYPV